MGIKATIGLISSLVFLVLPFSLVAISISGILLAAGITYNIAQGINNVECNSIVSKIPMELISTMEPISLEQMEQAIPKKNL